MRCSEFVPNRSSFCKGGEIEILEGGAASEELAPAMLNDRPGVLLDFVYYGQGLGEIGVKSGLSVEGSVAVGGCLLRFFTSLA